MTDSALSAHTALGAHTSGGAASLRAERVFAFLFGLLPFSVVVRFPPSSGFWGQWATVTVVLLWLASRPSAARVLPWGAMPFAAVALWLLFQLALGLAPMPIALLVAVAVLAIAAAACSAARSVALGTSGDSLVVGFAWGLLAAFALNSVAVAFELAGYEWMWVVAFKVSNPLPRAVGLIGQSNHLGVLAVYAVFAAIMLRWERRMSAWLFWPIVVVAGVVCAASASRVALVVWLAVMLFALVWRRGAATQPAVRFELLGVAVLFGAIQGGWILHDHSAAGQTAQVARSPDSGRSAMLRDAFALWEQHPILGVGNGNYAAQRLHALDGPLPAPHADHAHNLFAHAMAEWGSIGFAIVLAAFAYALWVIWRRLRDPARRPVEMLPCAWVLGLALHSLVEQPLWFANFLLPFALMLGWLAQPAVAASGPQEPTVRRSGRVVVILVAAVCGIAAADFLRSQRLAMRMLAELDRDPTVPALVSFADVAEVEALTLFPLPAKLMLAIKLPLGDAAIEAKIAVARQAMDAVPNAELIARWAAFSAIGGHANEPRAMLARLAERNPAYHEQALGFLRSWPRYDPRIAALTADVAQGTSSTAEPVATAPAR